jgi:hypothetical protein
MAEPSHEQDQQQGNPQDSQNLQIWDLWDPKPAATGLSFARGRIDPTDVLLVHAPPETLTVDVRTDDGYPVARGKELQRTADRPMARLTRKGSTIEREDLWPEEVDIGRLVILPGGEVGRLLQWWNAKDGSQWRWQVEFYNHK